MHTDREHSRRRERWIVLAVVLVFVVARSAVFVFVPGSHFDSDQAVTGLMAKHLSEGRAFPLFFYGQTYMLGVEAWLAAPESHHHHTHDRSIASFCLLRDQPLHAVTLSLLLETLAEHRGADLLRIKGLINLVESPDRPAVFHGVQHVVHPPAFLERWPTVDRRSRLVFIVRDVPQAWVEALLDALEAEVTTLSSNS